MYGPTTVNRWAYAATKEIDEFLALAWHQEHDLEVVVARLFNTIGPRQTGDYGMVVPNFVHRALAGEPLEVHDDGRQTRCFRDVDDCVRALMLLMDTPVHDRPGLQRRHRRVDHDRRAGRDRARSLRLGLARSSTSRTRRRTAAASRTCSTAGPRSTRSATATGWEPLIPLPEALDRIIAAERAAGRAAALRA